MTASDLDIAQSRVAASEPQSRTRVLAGPGAGKSHVVGALARNLIQDHGLWPDEILMISFSRAAVQVVRDRTQHLTDEGVRVSVSTLDALAADIVRESTPTAELRGYDSTILAATDILQQSTDHESLLSFRHVIIDEVQDVVGIRAQFAFEVLSACAENGAGFTLLGDPNQSLYDFQIEGPQGWSCETFLRKVDDAFTPDNGELNTDYRSRTSDAGRISRLRPELSSLDDEKRLRRLRICALDLPALGVLDEDAAHTVSGWHGTTVFLCDTNARTGVVADRLAALGVASAQLPSAADRPIPAWVSIILKDAEGPRVSRDRFLASAEEHVKDPELAWRTLLSISDSDRQLDVGRLAARISPNSFDTSTSEMRDVIVSTVHRAKGLEFDNVVVVDPEDWRTDEIDPSRTTRMLYVALSRAHSRVTRVTGCPTTGWFKTRFAADRQIWVRGPRGRRGGINGLMFDPAFALPCEASLRFDANWVGRPIDWSRADNVQDVTGTELPSWIASVDGVPVSRTSEDFGRYLAGAGRGKFPDLRGGRVEGFESIVTPAPVTSAGSLHLRPAARIAGVVELKWR